MISDKAAINDSVVIVNDSDNDTVILENNSDSEVQKPHTESTAKGMYTFYSIG